MTERDVAGQLRSSSTNERSRAIRWLLSHPDDVSSKELMRALQSESVPSLRVLLNEVLGRRQQLRPKPDVSVEAAPRQTRIAADARVDYASMIRHELSPAIGWIRLAADKEVKDFPRSATNDAIRKLQRKIDALVALVKEGKELTLSRVPLRDHLLDSWPHPEAAPSFVEGADSIDIETDEDLSTALLSNVYQNAIDASIEARGTVDVTIAWGHTPTDYWVRISNPFAGQQFALADVTAIGASSKTSHRGQGIALIRSVATRLGVTIDLNGNSGTAVFTMSGKRPNA